MLLLTRADPRRPAALRPGNTSICRSWRKTAETLLRLAEKHGLALEASGDITPTVVEFAVSRSPTRAARRRRCGTCRYDSRRTPRPRWSGRRAPEDDGHPAHRRFFDVDSGHFQIDGADVRELDPGALLDQIAIVLQDVYLFDDTIENNLRLARPGATWAKLHKAAHAARLDETIERLPGGWHTRVGEAGAQLSGGERQRVAIRRGDAEAGVNRAARRGPARRSIPRTKPRSRRRSRPRRRPRPHRDRRRPPPATLAGADCVIELDSGRVVETGTLAELQGTGGVFVSISRQYERARHLHIVDVTC